MILVALSLAIAPVGATSPASRIARLLVNSIIIFALFIFLSSFIKPLARLFGGDKSKKKVTYVLLLLLAIIISSGFEDYIWKTKLLGWLFFYGNRFTIKPIVNIIIVAIGVWFGLSLLLYKQMNKVQFNKIVPLVCILTGMLVAHGISLKGNHFLWDSKGGIIESTDKYLFGERTGKGFSMWKDRKNPYLVDEEERYGILSIPKSNKKQGLFVFIWSMVLFSTLIGYLRNRKNGFTLSALPKQITWLLVFLVSANLAHYGFTLKSLFTYTFFVLFLIVWRGLRFIGGENPSAVSLLLRGYLSYLISAGVLNLLEGEEFSFFPTSYLGYFAILVVVVAIGKSLTYVDKSLLKGVKSEFGQYLEELGRRWLLLRMLKRGRLPTSISNKKMKIKVRVPLDGNQPTENPQEIEASFPEWVRQIQHLERIKEASQDNTQRSLISEDIKQIKSRLVQKLYLLTLDIEKARQLLERFLRSQQPITPRDNEPTTSSNTPQNQNTG